MAKIKPIFLIGAAAVAAYIFKDKLFGAKQPDSEVDQADGGKPDAVIDTTKTGQSITQAVATAKQIAQGVQDIKVLIKTPDGQKDLSYTKGAKKPKRKKRKKRSRKTITTDYASYAPGYNPLLIK